MTTSANRKRRDVEFNVGDLVLLRLQPYRQTSVAKPQSHKLGQRYFGPYEVLERIGNVAYRLLLPVDCKIHDVFHVSLLRPFITSSDVATPLPTTMHQHQPHDVPVRASARRIVLVDRTPQEQWLVHWSSARRLNPMWESATWLHQHFPHLRLEDKAVSDTGGVDTDPLQKAHNTEAAQAQEPPPDNNLSNPTPHEAAANSPRPMRTKTRPLKYRDYISH